jgi:hypothetical protein
VAYTSASDAVGTDEFEYTITDGTDTVTGTVTVNLVDPVPLAAGKTFVGADEGDSATVTFGKLSPGAANARIAARTSLAAAAASSPKLTATFSEQLGSHSYKGKVTFNADDNDAEVVLNGGEDNVSTRFEITVDEDGAPKVLANGMELLPDSFDKKHPAPAGIVGTYTMAMRGSTLEGAPERGSGDTVASVILAGDGSVKIKGIMADGQPFTGSAQLGADNIAPFSIPLYKGKARGRFSGDLVFDPDNSGGSLTGSATWTKPAGIANLPMAEGFRTSGEIIGGFYTPEELPSTLAFDFGFGTDEEFTDFLATGTGTLAKKFAITGTPTFTLESKFTFKTGLILGKRPKSATDGPRAWAGVLLDEQAIIAGSAVFTDEGVEEIGIPATDYTVPVTGTFPP